MKKLSLLLLIATVLTPMFFIGCNQLNEPILPLATNEVRATISDFGSFDVTDVSSLSGNGYFSVKAPYKGTNLDDSLVITLFIPKQATAPYTVTVQSDDVALINYCIQQTSGTCTTFEAKKGKGSGTITVSSLTSEGTSQIMEGSFSGTLTNTTTGGTKTISNGSFKIRIN